MELIAFVVMSAIAMMCLAVNIQKKSSVFGLFSAFIFITIACLLFIGDLAIPSGVITTMNTTYATSMINYTNAGELYNPNPVGFVGVFFVCLGIYVMYVSALKIRG